MNFNGENVPGNPSSKNIDATSKSLALINVSVVSFVDASLLYAMLLFDFFFLPF